MSRKPRDGRIARLLSKRLRDPRRGRTQSASRWRRFLKRPKRKWGDIRTIHMKWRISLSVSVGWMRTRERNGLRGRSTWLERLRGATTQSQIWSQSSSPNDHHSTIHHHTQQHHFGRIEHIPAIRLSIQYISLPMIVFFYSASSSNTSGAKYSNTTHIELPSKSRSIYHFLSPKSLNFTMPLSLSSRLSGLMSCPSTIPQSLTVWITLLMKREEMPSKQHSTTSLNSSSFNRFSYFRYSLSEYQGYYSIISYKHYAKHKQHTYNSFHPFNTPYYLTKALPP